MLELKFKNKRTINFNIIIKLRKGTTKVAPFFYIYVFRYSLMNGIWGACMYSYDADSEAELMDKVNVGVGYSWNVWKGLSVDPNYTMPAKADEAGEREGSLNLSVSYKF